MVHQSSLCYKDLTLRSFVVSSTSVRCAQVINWKSVCMVLCCCVRYVEIQQNKEHSRTALIFCFHLKKTAAESYRLLREAYVNMLHRKIRMNDGLDVSKVVTSTQNKEEDKEHGKPSKNSKIWNCKHYWTKMVRKHKTNRRVTGR